MTHKVSPTHLYHRVLGGYSGYDAEEIEECWYDIRQNGLKPIVATAYSNLVPIEIRHLPIVWIGELEEVSSSWGCLLEIKASYLLKENLYPLNLSDVDWWVYQGEISPEAITRIENERERLE